jgi:hypothetical protein
VISLTPGFSPVTGLWQKSRVVSLKQVPTFARRINFID